MSFNLKNAFQTIINLQGRDMTFLRKGGTSVTIKAASSNYFRNFAAPEEMVIEGKEFVVSLADLEKQLFPIPVRRGDQIRDPGVFGSNTISEVKEMVVMGELIGYRLRTS